MTSQSSSLPAPSEAPLGFVAFAEPESPWLAAAPEDGAPIDLESLPPVETELWGFDGGLVVEYVKDADATSSPPSFGSLRPRWQMWSGRFRRTPEQINKQSEGK